MASHRIVVFLATATAIFVAFCFILLGLLIWREFYVDRPTYQYREEGVTLVEDPTWIKHMFPGYFKTSKEQANFELHLYTLNYAAGSRLSNTTVGNLSAIDGSCPIDKDSFWYPSACCFVGVNITAPAYLPSPIPPNSLLPIVQLPELDLRQYFEMTQCCQMDPCTFCKCHQAYILASALVYNPSNSNKVQIQPVVVPSCCQCSRF